MATPQLEMVLPSLDVLPAQVVPMGYVIRSYRPGDEAAWCRLVADGIGGDWEEKDFAAEVGKAAEFRWDDLVFAEKAEEAVGTAWALRQAGSPPDTGMVHMVAVEPQHRGRRLGRALVLAVLYRFRDLGMRRAALLTDDFRLPAIRIYLGLGFRPRLTHGSHARRWRDVCTELDLDYEEVVDETLPDA